jgi:cytochrome c oxidase assembly protein subunit 15
MIAPVSGSITAARELQFQLEATMEALARNDRSYILAVGFAATVTMWAVAYVGRLPLVMAPSWSLALLMLAAAAAWGWFAGRTSGDGWLGGALVGGTAAILNLLILGSLVAGADGGLRPSALWWVSGSIVGIAVLAGVAAAVGSQSAAIDRRPPDWTAMFSKVAVAATFLLVVAGGLVTSQEAGLAVVDWPNTFGSNMFLYPLSRMTGGIYYEHAHRLFGALVGITTLALAAHLWRVETRPRVRRLALLALIVVVIQGILGGLRVTGQFTLSTSLDDMAPSIGLAIVHGVLGQLFLALIVSIAVVTSRWWQEAPPAEARPSADTDRSIQVGLVAVLAIQLVFGAVQRHVAQGLLIHITLATVVTVIAIAAGARAWGLYHGAWPVQRLGQLLMGLVCVQVALGIAALAVTQGRAVVGSPTTVEVTIATAHQATGAALLAVSVALALWARRLFQEQFTA